MTSRTVEGIRFPISVRPGTTDDQVFQQIFNDREYEIPVYSPPQLIIDGGANVGYGSIWFANRFPEAHILAFEIEGSNFAILEQNVKPYPNVIPKRQAIWSERTVLEVKKSHFEWSGEWDFVCKKPDSRAQNLVPSISIGEVLENSGFSEISILKLDIEGAEREVFLNGFEQWLDKVQIIIIELHELYSPGAEKAFYSAVSRLPFDQTVSGENIVLHRKCL